MADLSQQVAIVDRDAEILELRIAGVPEAEIATRFDLSIATVKRRVSKAIRDRLPEYLVEENRNLDLARLDRLIQMYVGIIRADEPSLDAKLRAADGLHKVIVTRSKLLGTETPVKLAVELPSDADDQITELLLALGLDPVSDLA